MNKIISLVLVSVLILTLYAAIPPAHTQQTTIKVLPAFNEFGNSAGDPIPIPGTTFTVTVGIYDVENLYGFDLKFQWNTEYLAYVTHNVWVPRNTTPGGILYAPIMPVKNEVYPTEGWYWISYSSMSPAPPFSGSGIAFNMTFEVIKQPYDYETGGPGVDPIDTLLNFRETDLADSGGRPIPHTVEPATVRIWEKRFVPPTYPVIKVMPAKVENLPICTNFNIAIWILGLDPFYDLAAFDIKLTFNSSLIEALAITEGPYLKSYANETYEILKVIDNPGGFVRYALTQIPPRTPPPPSNGILFNITFHVIYESTTYPPPQCNLTIDCSSELALWPHPEIPAPPYEGKDYSVPLPFTKDHGLYIARFKPLGRAVDLYVCDFPEPFKGTGPNVPCEGYKPQKMVNLKANVTYNLWPVQFKLVTFEIHDPLGRLVAVRTAFSDENGVARVSYRLPWPCAEWPDMFGVWTVIATVDIYCEIVNDTLQFKVWWPLELLSVEPLEDSYAVGEHMAFKVTMRTCFVWTYNATIVLVVYDEVGQPIGHKIVTMTYGFNNIDEWCNWKEYEITIDCITVPKWTAVGAGRVYVSALSGMPWNGGDGLCPEVSAPVGLTVP